MENLQITKACAIKAYNDGDAGTKKLLESLFGTAVLTQKITDRVKTYEDAVSITKVVIATNIYDTTDELAYKKLKVIALALNEGWTPDWSNDDQYKYFPWFRHKPGFGLSYDGFDYWRTSTDAGSRLCYARSELAEYAGKQFESLYRDFLSL